MKKNPKEPMSLEALQTQLQETQMRIAMQKAQQLEDEQQLEHLRALPETAPEKQEAAAFFARTEADTLRRLRSGRASGPQKAPPRRYLRALLVALLLLLLGFGTALALSPALRVSVMRLFYHSTPEYTDIRLQADKEASFEVPAQWEGLYFPSYLPHGYKLYAVEEAQGKWSALYTKDQSKLLSFHEMPPEYEERINTKGFVISETQVYGRAALLASRFDTITFVWSSPDRLFVLSANEPMDEVEKMVHSLTRIR